MAHRPPLGRGRLGLLFFALFPPDCQLVGRWQVSLISFLAGYFRCPM